MLGFLRGEIWDFPIFGKKKLFEGKKQFEIV